MYFLVRLIGEGTTPALPDKTQFFRCFKAQNPIFA